MLDPDILNKLFPNFKNPYDELIEEYSKINLEEFNCDKCNEYNKYAKINTIDNKYICYSCRNY